MKTKNDFWNKKLKEDQLEINKINRAVKRKDRKFLDKWFDRYNREGTFWDKKSKKNDYL